MALLMHQEGVCTTRLVGAGRCSYLFASCCVYAEWFVETHTERVSKHTQTQTRLRPYQAASCLIRPEVPLQGARQKVFHITTHPPLNWRCQGLNLLGAKQMLCYCAVSQVWEGSLSTYSIPQCCPTPPSHLHSFYFSLFKQKLNQAVWQSRNPAIVTRSRGS